MAASSCTYSKKSSLGEYLTTPFNAETYLESNLSLEWQDAGSNAWAIAPSRSANGNAMLLANLHLPWSDGYLLSEAQLTAPEINAYGATLIGLPILVMALLWLSMIT